MQVSEARLAANRLNGLRSKGPTSETGKLASRMNACKHNLSGTVVTADIDAEEIQARAEALTADLRPQTTAGSILIVKMATLSVRMERAAEHESAQVALKIRHAGEDFDDAQLEQVETLFDSLADNPHTPMVKLKRTPTGVSRLIRAWGELSVDLELDAWTDERLEQAANLTGWKARHALGTRLGTLTRAMRGDFVGLPASDGGGLNDEARKAWAKARLAEAIEAEIVGLEAHYETLDHELLALDRAEAGQRALVDGSKSASLARRYETEARRGFLRALKEFRQVEAEFAAQSEPTTPPAQPASSVGSFRQMPVSPPSVPPRPGFEAIPTDFAPVSSESEPLCYVPRVNPAS